MLDKVKNIHFIGIGGIGVSAVARMFLLEGKNVSGSDMSESKVTEELKSSGAKIFIGHSEKNIPIDVDLVIYTIAIPKDNPEFVEAEKRKIKMLTYPESLREISKNKFTIAVSGTHGKTTTTAMIAKIMIDAGLDPTVIVGSFLKDFTSNFIAGKSEYFVVEACEYKKSFLNLNPDIAVLTNIDNDHLDYYKDIFDIQNAFDEFLNKVDEDGYIVTDENDKKTIPVIKNKKTKIVDYTDFIDEKIILKSPGKHNLKNAGAALAVAHIIGVDKKKAVESLKNFSGTWRRLEYKGETKNGVEVYDDYAHHPTEIKATLEGMREKFPNQKIFVVFQPHLYSRTKLLINEFRNAFKDADEVILAPIYAAREKFDPSISSEILAEKIENKNTITFSDINLIENYILEKTKNGDILITMGAGDIYKVGEKLL